MAELALVDAIPRFKQNEDRMDRFTNGTALQSWIASDGTSVPSLRKFLADKGAEINAEANSILSASENARDAAQAWAESPTAPGGAGTKSAKTLATEAGNSASAASGSADAAATSEANADNSATESADSAALAQAWADTSEDEDVAGAPPGSRSARHWATKALEVVVDSVSATIHGSTSKTLLAAADEIGVWNSVTGELCKISVADFWAQLKWQSMPIGWPYLVDTSLVGADIPPASSTDTVWIELTAGLTGAGAFNAGKLTTESVSGSAPLVLASAVVSLADSPLNGKTIRLLNTEGRILRPSTSPGTLQNDAIQNIIGTINIGALISTSGVFSTTSASVSRSDTNRTDSSKVTFDASDAVRTSTETRMKNLGVKAYMRIK